MPATWPYLLVTGCFQAMYYLGLLQGYKSGDFTVVYPVARALPVLILAFVDWGVVSRQLAELVGHGADFGGLFTDSAAKLARFGLGEGM
ncbi:MAG: hypothetical protein H6658_18620 [Ardenticatenaceae bacterium]|nr:hypothetical protein [Ardenticatenaceae bacterium]